MRRGIACLILGVTLILGGAWKPHGALAQSLVSTPSPSQPVPAVWGSISQPLDGASLRGSVVISGSAAGAWSLSFSYLQSPVETWFPLAQSSVPLQTGSFATWDTSNLTDGLYNLKLSVLSASGNQAIIVKVRVNNYSFVETDTATALPSPSSTLTPTATIALTPTATPTLASTATIISTATLQPTRTVTARPTETSTTTATAILPATDSSRPAPTPDSSPATAVNLTPGPNPAALSAADIFFSLGKGILAVFALFLLAAISLSLRRK